MKREWYRLHKRLRWALRLEVDVVSNVRPGAKLARLRAGAKQRNLTVQLTLAEYVELTEGGRCHYCDGPLPESGHGLDRKNTDLGYSRFNVVMACDACNRIKGDVFSYAQMMEIGGLLRAWRAQGLWNDPQRKDGKRPGGRPLKGDLRREIEEWNARWAGDESLHLAFGSRSDGPGGSSVVREGGGAYTVERFGAQLANEVNDVRTSLVRGPRGPYRLQTDRARRGPARDVIAAAGLG